MSAMSMTGYGRADGRSGDISWRIELKAVNGKGLELRPRLPSLFDGMEPLIRERLSKYIQRGNIHIALSLDPGSQIGDVQINESILDAYAKAAERLEKRFDLKTARAADFLGLKGVVEFNTLSLDEQAKAQLEADFGRSLEAAAQDLNISRAEEGARLVDVLSRIIDDIEVKVNVAYDCAALQPEKLQQRLKEQLEKLLSDISHLDEARLAQEVALLATKADVTEELDRLRGHVAAARDLLKSGEAIGRGFDFLGQEFFREANTLCSKSSDSRLTQIGLDMKALIEQVREQVKNLE